MKNTARFLLLALLFGLILTACSGTVQDEEFDFDFNGGGSAGVDLDGFEMVYEFGTPETEGLLNDNVLGYTPNTIFSDLALERLNQVQQDYNCKITVNYNNTDNCHKFVSTSMSGIFMCDVISGISDMWSNVARIDMLVGMSEVSDYIDYKNEEKWGTRNMLEVIYYEDDLYGLFPMAWPELCISYFGYPLVFNENYILSRGMTDPREYVENGTWDYENFRQFLVDATDVQGGETRVYGLSTHREYFTEMFMRTNGSSLIYKDANGNYQPGFYTSEAMKAMEEAVNLYYGDYAYTINHNNADVTGSVDCFIEGRSAMCVALTKYLYGQDARISMNVDRYGIVTWPHGPDADPSRVYSIMENNEYCIAISRMTSSPDACAIILNALYEPLPGFETYDQIRDHMLKYYFFDERDCDNFYAMFNNQEYNYFHYGVRATTINFLDSSSTSITQVLERNRDKSLNEIEEYIMPSIRGIIAVWGDYEPLK